MQWTEIRRTYPRQWLLVEALSAHSVAGKRIGEDLTVVDLYPDGRAAMTGYKELHRREPGRGYPFKKSTQTEVSTRTLKS
ncbi:MAG: hypothetical protein WAM82_17400 [Thermoanaerobaculia bacterium]